MHHGGSQGDGVRWLRTLASGLDFASLRWIGGAYLLVFGASMLLLLPGASARHQHMMLEGTAVATAGLLLLWVAAAGGSVRAETLAHGLAGTLLGLTAWYEWHSLHPILAASYTVLAGCVALGAAAPTGVRGRVDIFALSIGIAAMLRGVGSLLIPELELRADTPADSLLLICMGLAIAATHLHPGVSMRTRRAVHLAAGVGLAASWLPIAFTGQPNGQIIALAGVERACFLAALPHMGSWLGRADRRSARLRVSVALAFAAILPVLISLPLLLMMVDAGGAARDTSTLPSIRAVATALLLGTGLASGVAGWWFAGRMTRSLRGIEAALARIAAGEPGVTLPISSTTELRNLAATITTMVDAMQERSAELEAVMRTAPVALRGYGTDGRVRFLNPRAIAHLGVLSAGSDVASVDELAAMNPLEDPEGNPIPIGETPTARALRGESVRDLTIRLATTAGPAWRSISAEPVVTHDGRILGAVSASIDITARMELATALAERTAELEALLQTIPAGIMWFDQNGRQQFTNETARSMVGDAAHTAVAGMPVEAVVARLAITRADGRTLTDEQSPTRRALRGEVVRDEVVQMQRDDGTRVWQSLNAAPIRRADGSVKGAVLLSLDISQRQELNEQLAERTAELETVLAAVPVAIRRYDAEGRLLFTNQAAAQFIDRYPALRRAPRFASQGLPPGAADEHGMPLTLASLPTNRALEGETVQDFIYQHRGDDGTPIWKSVSAAPVLTAGGRMIGAVTVSVGITQRQQLTARLAERTAELEAVLQTVPVSIRRFDTKGRLLFANPTALAYDRAIGLTPRQRTDAAHVAKVAHFEDAEGRPLNLADMPVMRALRGEQVHGTTLRHWRPDGMQHWWNISAAPVLGGDGSVLGAVSAAVDITARQHLTEQLAAKTARWEALLQAAPTSLIEYDAEQRVVFANAGALAVFGESLQQPLAVRWAQGNNRDEAGRPIPLENSPVCGALRGETVQGARIQTTTVDGVATWRSVSAAPIRDGDGKVVGAVTLGLDVTPQQELMAALGARTAQWEALLRAAPIGIALYDAEGRVTFMNETAYGFLGFKAAPLGASYQDLFDHAAPLDPDGAPQLHSRSIVGQALAGHVVHGQITQTPLPNGRTRWLSTSAAPAIDAAGALVGVVAVAADITELEELSQQRLDMQQAVSHDLANPLTAIQGFSDLLRRHLAQAALPMDAHEALDSIIEQSKRMSVMIKELSEAGRLEASNLQVSPRPLAFGTFVAGFLRRNRATLPTTRIACDAPDTTVLADSNALERVLGNLLSNAAKYSGPNDPIHLRAEVHGQTLVVSVQDHGDGVAAEHQAHLFSRFFRVATTKHVDGLGLGLYIARLYVEAQGGRIWVESRPGDGATFRFTLPLGV